MTLRTSLWLGVATTLAVSPLTHASDPIEADWLYLTGQGAWVQRSAELRQQSTALPLPVDNLETAHFWWQAEHPDLTLTWQTPERKWWVTEDTVVQIDGWSGSWTVVNVSDDLLMLAQAGVRKPLPRDQWYRLSWVVGQNIDDDFELQVRQSEARSNPFDYAWFDPSIAAEVRYSLDLTGDPQTLNQQLVLHNQSDYSLRAPGYSYAQSTAQGPVMARQTMMAESDTAAGAPKAGDSSGQATLKSEEPVSLPSGSHAWLMVEASELSSVRHHYQFGWNTRQTQTVPGQWSLQLRSEDDLPAIAGPVQVAVWDQEVALLETQYRPQENTSATLSLGSSDLVTLASEPLGGNEWRLTLTNRNSFEVETRIQLNHWDNDRNEQASISLPVGADSEVRLRARLGTNQLTVRPE
ncbi:hypothetical protein [Saccharospirillum salsuginis]|uniref:Uncharacterized protein n=1 Tax=Saccharospirillum salsuginis TaxID=418750 RepID=A0A918N8M8_9GAMM|nr:hypothetical protein [Saccharospirillum salsuginis]GGX47642.1 hypothetical protein GCM10007392_13120 [Saccharospirillum salsuginis]